MSIQSEICLLTSRNIILEKFVSFLLKISTIIGLGSLVESTSLCKCTYSFSKCLFTCKMCKALWETLMRSQRGTGCSSSFKEILIAFNAFINQFEFTGLPSWCENVFKSSYLIWLQFVYGILQKSILCLSSPLCYQTIYLISSVRWCLSSVSVTLYLNNLSELFNIFFCI